MNNVTVSVPLPVSLVRSGKAGQPMLFAATDIRMRVIIKRGSTHIQESLRKILQKATDGVRKKYPEMKSEEWSINAMGSQPGTVSANTALLVGTIGGLLYACRKIWNPLATQEIAYSIVKNDYEEAPAIVAACVAGGIIWSRRELPFLTSTWQLPIRLPPQLQKFSISFMRMERSNGKSSSRAIAIALKERDEQTLRSYYRGGVVSLPGDSALWYEGDTTRHSKAIEIGGDGIRLESK